MEDKRAYLPVVEQLNVLVKVPKEGSYMAKIEENEFELHGKMIKVATHWKNGMLLSGGGQKILNRLFYEITEKDLGRKIVARVDIKEKTTRDGRKYIMLDIHKALISDGPSLKIKFVEDLEEGGINIPQTETKIVFRSMPH